MCQNLSMKIKILRPKTQADSKGWDHICGVGLTAIICHECDRPLHLIKRNQKDKDVVRLRCLIIPFGYFQNMMNRHNLLSIVLIILLHIITAVVISSKFWFLKFIAYKLPCSIESKEVF